MYLYLSLLALNMPPVFAEPLRRRVPQHLGAFATEVGLAELRRGQLGATARVQDDGPSPGAASLPVCLVKWFH